MNQNIEIIKEALVTTQAANNVPVCAFKKNTPVGSQLVSITNVGNFKGSTEKPNELVNRWLNEASGESESIKQPVNDMVNAFVTQIKDSRKLLAVVKDTVDNVTKDIDADINRHIELDPKMNANTAEAEMDFTIESYDFSMLKALGSKKSLSEHIESVLNGADLNTASAFSVVKGKYITSALQNTTLGDMVLQPEVKMDIVDSVNKSDSATTRDMVIATMELYCSETKTTRLRNTVERTLRSYTDPNEALFFFTDLINKHAKIISDLEVEMLKRDIDVSVIAGNMKTVMALLEIGGYFVHYQLEFLLADTVLFSNEIKNPALQKKLDANNITDKEICQHKRDITKTVPMSKVGLTLTRIMSNRERVRKLYEAQDKNAKAYNALMSTKYKEGSMIRLLSSYIKSIGRTPDVARIQHMVNHAVRTDVSTCDVVYDVMIELHHSGTLVEKMYREMGKAYVTLLATNNEINAKLVNEANATVYATLVATFMKDHFIA